VTNIVLHCDGAWGGLVVKALRYWSEGPGIDPGGVTGDFYVAQPLKNEYQNTPWGKDGRCVRLTTYRLQLLMSRNLEALTSQNPLDPQACNGYALPV
jgi:hypothetical protein